MKSKIVQRVAKAHGLDAVDMRLVKPDPADLRGLPQAKALREPKRGAKNIVTIDADQWAESGGTGGMFGPAWRAGRLRIMPSAS